MSKKFSSYKNCKVIQGTNDLLDLINHNTNVTSAFVGKQLKINKRSKILAIAVIVVLVDQSIMHSNMKLLNSKLDALSKTEHECCDKGQACTEGE